VTAAHLPTISVIVPVFNSAHLVGQTLTAIFAQTQVPLEVIAIDDGSTDGSAEVLRQFPVRLLHQANAGPGQARNAGVAVARGDWLAFCDHDDLWRPTYLERFSALMTPGSFYGFANFTDVIDDKWGQTDKFATAPADFFSQPDQPLYSRLIDFTPVWPSASLIQRDYFNAIGGFNPKFSRYATEDLEFNLRCNERAPALVLHDVLVGIRKHIGNYSAGKLRQQLSDSAILDWSNLNHRLGLANGAAMQRAVRRLRLQALDVAFADGDLAHVREIAALLGAGSLPVKQQIKHRVAQSRVVPGGILRWLLNGRSTFPARRTYESSSPTPE
jgi:glycosyltransferase involved in cell wall biosynthesis